MSGFGIVDPVASGDAPGHALSDGAALRVTPEQVAADPLLREAARTLADLYLCDGYLTRWLDGDDHTPVARREFVADLIDADHSLDWRERWLELLAGSPPCRSDEPEPWLIDRPWRT